MYTLGTIILAYSLIYYVRSLGCCTTRLDGVLSVTARCVTIYSIQVPTAEQDDYPKRARFFFLNKLYIMLSKSNYDFSVPTKAIIPIVLYK